MNNTLNDSKNEKKKVGTIVQLNEKKKVGIIVQLKKCLDF